MFYGHGVSTDQDFLNDEPKNFLTIQYAETFYRLTNPGQKVVYPPDQLKIHLLVNHRGFDGLQFRHQCRISFPQPVNPTPQFRKLHEPFLVCIEQSIDPALYAGDLLDECLFSCFRRMGISGFLDPSVDLLTDQVGVFK
jgi:hypothetical protein